jgi:hypothetical protein
MAHNTGMMGNQREFGLHGSPGKGSKERTSNRKKYHDNYDAIDWNHKPGEQHPFVANPNLLLVARKGNRVIKKYK